MSQRGFAFWALQCPGWLLLIYLVYAQGISAFGYELGVAMGTQEPAETITEVGAAFWYGFAFGDLVTYMPLLGLGLIGHLRGAYWGRIALAAALGITVYWPVVSLAALVDARDAAGWNISDEMPYWIVCLVIAFWGAWGLWELLKKEGAEPVATENPDSPQGEQWGRVFILDRVKRKKVKYEDPSMVSKLMSQ